MKDPLETYLNDHLAGSVVAVSILKILRDQHAGRSLGGFAAGMLAEIEADRAVLQRLIQRVGAEASASKRAIAWVGGRASRLKLRRLAAGDLGTFEALELLALGILGKRALWRALAAIQPADDRLGGADFAQLEARAQAQHDRVEERRLETAPVALRGVSK
jgi:hypothetical protein